jgi:hypothetical protein
LQLDTVDAVSRHADFLQLAASGDDETETPPMVVRYLAEPPQDDVHSHTQADPYAPFAKPHNWCDRRCERCPIQNACILRLRDLQRRWVHEARREDPDDPAVVRRDVQANLERVAELVRQAAADEDIDIDIHERPPNQPIVLDMVRLQRAGFALVGSLDGAFREAPDDACVGEALSIAFKLACKCGRVSGYLGGDRNDIWLDDVVPNLLLIEHLFGRLDEVVAANERHFDHTALDATRAARRELARILAPLFADLPATARLHMTQLIERDLAPSPFSVIASRSP